jgi:putative GTP pyrophosphokinase
MVETRSTYSKNRVNRAGMNLRVLFSGQPLEDYSTEDFAEDVRVLNEFRRSHAYPLVAVTANLRHYVDKHGTGQLSVAQRLKRLPTIVDKLKRLPDMQLARMEDVGGCRAVVASTPEIMSIVDDLSKKKTWRIVRARDYIADPKPDTGYRAYHFVVEKHECRIEVQLRTRSQHAWAEHVEAIDRRNPGLGLKVGQAPADVEQYFCLGAELLEAQDLGAVLETSRLREFSSLHGRLGTALQEGTYVRADT